jgi:hypothetical protein
MEKEDRKKIGVVGTEPKRVGYSPEGLTERQMALREAIVNRFTTNKIKRYITEQLRYINYHRHISEGLKILFDERGNPPANAPIFAIIEARQKLESQVKMLEAICSALHSHIVQIKEIESAAFEMIKQEDSHL